MVAKTFAFPNIRKIFVPDPGYVMFDMDLDRADLQVVVWEADDPELKSMLREGVDLHIENAKVLFNKTDITKSSPERQFAKTFVHGTNYGGGARTMAINSGITVATSEAMQARWFSAHPRIKKWQERVEAQLRKRFISNPFGHTIRFFDRIEGLLPEALAWIPQSTVACVTNIALERIDRLLPEVELQLPVHDSIVGQFPEEQLDEIVPKLLKLGKVMIPYPDPLTIPVSIKVSTASWGDCKAYEGVVERNPAVQIA
jgi:DNA polymerase I